MYQRPDRPRTIGGVLDDAVRLYRVSARYWWLPSLLLALLATAAESYYALQIGPRPTPGSMMALYKSPQMILTFGIRMLLTVYLYMVMQVSMAAIATGADLPLAGAFRKALRLLPATILGTIASLLASLVGLVLLIIPGVYVFGRLYYWSAALCIDQPETLGSLAASWRVVKGHWWRSAAILTVLFFLVIAMLVVMMVVEGALVGILRPTSLSGFVAVQSVAQVLNIVVVPAAPAAAIATYLDLRLRAEGSDLEARVKQLAG